MLRQGSVGWQVSRSSQHDPFKHTLSSYPREHSASINIARRHNLGNSSLSRDGWHHHSQSPHVTMAVSHLLTQITNPGNAIPSTTSGEVVIVGAGPAGCLLSHYLLRRGFSVHLFEKRASAPPPRPEESECEEQVYVRGDSRSYTILLTSRAVKALEGAGLELPPNLLNLLVGSCVHQANGKKRLFNYSNEPGLLSFGVSRNALVTWLQQSLLGRYSKLKTYFEYELLSIDESSNTARFQYSSKSARQDKPGTVEVSFDLLVGADGVNSAVRSEMIRLTAEDSLQPFSILKNPKPITLDFKRNGDSYKSFYVGPELAKKSPLFTDHNRVQSWPALNMLLVGMADGSFWGGSKNAGLLNASSPHELELIFKEKAPEVFELLEQENPNFSEDFLQQPAISFGGAVTLSRFHHKNIIVIGDAAHAMFPSYGTGCNAALEDCLLLDSIVNEFISSGNGDISCNKLAAEFSRRRVDDAHAIVELNTNMKLFPRGFFGILQTMLLTSLHKLAPTIFKPTSYQLLWSDTPFRQIDHQKRNEDRLFYGLLLVLGLLVVAALSFAFGIQPKLKLKF